MNTTNTNTEENAATTNAAERTLPPLSEVPLFTEVAPIMGSARVKQDVQSAYLVALGATVAIVFSEHNFRVSEKRAVIDYVWQNRHFPEHDEEATEVPWTLEDYEENAPGWLTTYQAYLKEAKATVA